MITLLLSISLAYAEDLSLNYQEALNLALDQNFGVEKKFNAFLRR